MRRWITGILICLILGAITTVVAAWFAAWYFNEGGGYDTLVKSNLGGASLTISAGRGFAGSRKVTSYQWSHDTPARRSLNDLERCALPFGIDDADSYFKDVIWIERIDGSYGWPIPALRIMWEMRLPGLVWTSHGAWVPPVNLDSFAPAPERGTLPTIIMWRAFAVDTVIFATFWMGLSLLLLHSRTMQRRRRGRCPRCGYDLRGQRMAHGLEARAAGCPECGWGRMNDKLTR